MTIRTWSRTKSFYGAAKTRRGTTLDLADELRGDYKHTSKDGPGFCGAEFRDGRKRLDHCVRVWHLSLDIDAGVDVPEIWLNSLPWEYIAYSSYSDQLPGKGRRFRVIIPLVEPLSAEDFRELGKWALAKWPYLDPTIQSAATSYFSPRTPDHGVKPWFKHKHGPALDATPIVEERKEAKRIALEERKRKAAEAMEWRKKNADHNIGPYLNAIVENGCARIVSSPTGARHATMYNVGRTLGGYLAGENLGGDIRASFVSALENAGRMAGLSDNILRQINNALDEGENAPLMVPPPPSAMRKQPREPENVPPPRDDDMPEFAAPPRKLRIKDTFRKAPVSDGAMLPDGYEVSRGGVYSVKYLINKDGTPKLDHEGVQQVETKRVSPRPIFIHKRFRADKVDHIGVTWLDDLDGWREARLTRGQMYGNQIIKLADAGAPVTANTAKGLINYLEAYEHANSRCLPRVELVDRLGWHGQEFLIGDRTITERGVEPATRVMYFHEKGDSALAESIHAKGSFAAWVEAANSIRDFPYSWICIAAAIAAPLLSITQTDTFIVDNAYQTSSGKTVSIYGGSSVWGNPRKGHFTGTWLSTKVGIEETLAMMADLPVFMDETKHADKEPAKIQSAIYMITGAGKKRGKAGGGLRKTKSWRTVFVTCGEQQMYSYGNDDGARARTIGAEGPCFYPQSEAMKQFVDDYQRKVHENYGHAGPQAVQYICQHRESWRDKVDHWEAYFAGLEDGATNSKGLRKARYFAVLRVSLDILATLGVNYDPKHLDDIWRSSAGAKDVMKSDRALVVLSNWITLNWDSFHGTGSSRPPQGKWAGIIEEGKHVTLPKRTLKTALEDMWEPTLTNIWNRGGHLIGSKGSIEVNARLGKGRLRGYRFKWASLMGGVQDDSPV